MNRDDVIEILTQWGISNRVHNYCGWYTVSVLGRIENENVHRVNIPQPNTEKAIQGLSEDDKPIKVGADPKQLDKHMIKAIESIMTIASPLERSIATQLYVKIPINPKNRRQRGESWVASKLMISRDKVRAAHNRLILLIQNEIELIH